MGNVCFYWSLLNRQKVLLHDEGRSVKPVLFSMAQEIRAESAQHRAPTKEEQPIAAGSPGSRWVEILLLQYGWWAGGHSSALVKPLQRAPLSTLRERSEDDTE